MRNTLLSCWAGSYLSRAAGGHSLSRARYGGTLYQTRETGRKGRPPGVPRATTVPSAPFLSVFMEDCWVGTGGSKEAGLCCGAAGTTQAAQVVEQKLGMMGQEAGIVV